MSDDVERVIRALPRLERYVETAADNTTTLERAGGELRGANPWHGSSTGNNFAVDPDQDQWFCHSQGCKAGGGILEYIAVDEGIVGCGETADLSADFPEVLEIAAEKAGVDLDMDAQDRQDIKQRREEREKLDDAYAEAADLYHRQLDATLPRPDGEGVLSVREWLHEVYGLTDDCIDDAMIGFAPPDGTALKRFVSASETTLLKAGLAVDTADGIKDFFDGRIVFPYFEHGTPRFFIGRKTPLTPDEPWEGGKYRKLPTADNHDAVSEQVDEPIYGRDGVRSASALIVTEGVTDVLAAQQYGYAAIAPVTTTFKASKARDVARLVSGKDVAVIMDEDADSGAGLAGARKTAQTIRTCTGRATDVGVARLPLDDGDLCDYLRENGGEL